MLKFFSRVGSTTAIAVGSLVLIGWVLDITILKSVLPGLVMMKANAALAFILAGAALWLLQPDQVGPRTRPIAQVCATIVALIGLVTLFEYLFDWNAGVDRLLFTEPAGVSGTSYPGRMASATALNFVLVGLALLLLDAEPRRDYPLSQFLILPAAVISLLGLIGYALDINTLYTVPFSSSVTSMALHTAATFTLLCAGILAARPERGLVALFSGKSIEHKVIGVFVMLVALVVIFAAVSYHSTRRFIQDSRQVAHTQEVLKELETTLSLMKDAVIGHHRYVITEDERYLEPYDVAVSRMPDQLKRVRDFTADNPIQKSRLDLVEPLIAANLAFRAESIKLQKTKGAEAARQRIKTGLGVRQMDEIRKLIAEMEKEELGLLVKRNEQSQARAQTTMAFILSVSVLSFLIVVGATVFVMRELISRRLSEQTRARLVAILESASDFVGFADAKDKHILYVNRAGRIMTGLGEKEDVTKLKIADVHPEWTNQMLRHTILPAAIRDGFWTGECAFLHRDGHEIPVLMALHSHKTSSGEVDVFSTISRDITERKRAEQLQSRFLEKIITVSNEERRQIANELQNEIGRALTNLLVELTTLGSEPSLSETKKKANKLRITTSETLHELRLLTMGLYPNPVDKLGLENALRQFAIDYGQTHGLTVRIEAVGLAEQRSPVSVETGLYHIAQEALANVVQHASAKTVTISLHRNPSEMQMTIEDDGRGFDVNETQRKAAASAQIGFWTIQRHVQRLNGSLTIDSEPGKGTTIIVRVPLNDTASPNQG